MSVVCGLELEECTALECVLAIECPECFRCDACCTCNDTLQGVASRHGYLIDHSKKLGLHVENVPLSLTVDEAVE